MPTVPNLTSIAELVASREGDRFAYRSLVDGLSASVVHGNAVAETLGWLAAITEIEELGPVPLVVVRQAISSLSWADRAVGNAIPTTREMWSAIPEDGVRSDRLRLYAAYFVSQRLRFDFRFESLRVESQDWVTLPPDAQLAAMLVFAKMGLHLASATEDLAVLQANFTLDEVCRDILLHALWFGTHLADQAEQILELSDDVLAHGDASANVYFRRAFAYRRKGELEHASVEIHRAIELLGPGENDIHQDYVRELELIQTTGMFREQVRGAIDEQLAGALEALDARARSAEELVSGSMINMVEVLGLFIALIGFLGAGAVTLFNQMNHVTQIVTIVLLFVGSIGFFLTLRFIVRSGSLRFWKRSRKV